MRVYLRYELQRSSCAKNEDQTDHRKPRLGMNAKLLGFAYDLSGFALIYLINPHTKAGKEALEGYRKMGNRRW